MILSTGGRAWLPGGVCGWGGMHVWLGGACMPGAVHGRGHAWLGGMHGQGACMPGACMAGGCVAGGACMAGVGA